MFDIKVHHDFKFPKETIFALLADFGNIEGWWPTNHPEHAIEKVINEGSGMGMTRHIYNVGFPNPISERLDWIDPERFEYKLSVTHKQPVDMIEYSAVARFEDIEGGCRMHYHSNFLTSSGKPDESDAFLRGAYLFMFEGLEQAATRVTAAKAA
ncbi:SRPBCC family protein [Paraburkholderia sp. BR14374]|uniref:SRPBCC family protein n=1 Tax=Paraburkholderia sp. BR14374 TaxID=3237007 RepID=UPI0034CED3EF